MSSHAEASNSRVDAEGCAISRIGRSVKMIMLYEGGLRTGRGLPNDSYTREGLQAATDLYISAQGKGDPKRPSYLAGHRLVT